jgi:small conductance mechanosensitive channel
VEVVQDTQEKLGLIKEYGKALLDWLMSKAGSVVVAIIFMIICFKLVKWLVKILRKTFEKSNLDASVAGFFISAIKVLLEFIVLITAASIMGFQVTSFITLLGTAGVTLGLALQGSLSNLAGGVLILILKPFRVGDYIVENSTHCEGVVVSIDIFYTKLTTVDNRIVVIPNGSISNTSLINVTAQEKRRVDIEVGVSYDSDLDKVKKVALEAVSTVPGYMPQENTDFFIDAFAESSIKLFVRFYAEADKYFDARWAAMWNIKKAFDENDIVIPYNKLDVNIHESKA